jgi:hypothetical protein
MISGGIFMNKIPAFLAIFIFLALPAFSQDLALSTGYGVTLGANFDTLSVDLNDDSLETRQSYSQFNYGGLLFLDAVYVTAEINFSGSVTSFTHSTELKRYTYVNEDYELAGMNLGFGLYGKYPFNLDRLILFPLLGVQFSLGLSQNFTKDFEARNAKAHNSYGIASDWSTFIFKAGAGLDFDINETIFLRGGLLFIYKLNSLLDQAFVDAINNHDGSNAINMNFGFEFEILIGYKLGLSIPNPFALISRINAERNRTDDDNIFYPESGMRTNDDDIFYPENRR